jgi:hypothetical protein
VGWDWQGRAGQVPYRISVLEYVTGDMSDSDSNTKIREPLSPSYTGGSIWRIFT